MNTMTRRRTIDDELITTEIFDKIAEKMLEKIDDIYTVKQSDILPTLLNYNLSNKTIAKMMNYLIPSANASAGSIASLIRSSKKKNDLLNDLCEKLNIELED